MDAVAQEIVSVRQAGIDLPVWYAFPEGDRSFEVAANLMPDFLLDETLGPLEFADVMLKDSLARGPDAKPAVFTG
jgi:hypothetical protein